MLCYTKGPSSGQVGYKILLAEMTYRLHLHESRPRTLWEGSHTQAERIGATEILSVIGEQAGAEGLRARAAVKAKRAQHERYWLLCKCCRVIDTNRSRPRE